MFRSLLLFSMILPFPVRACGSENEGDAIRAAEQKHLERIKEIAKSSDVPISFFGKVVDQDGNPVVGASVFAHLRHFTETNPPYFMAIKQLTSTTDAQGLFEFKGIAGKGLFIKDIKKDEFMFSYDKRKGFDYHREGFCPSGMGLPSLRPPDKHQPVIFQLRKRGKPTFVLKSEGDFCLKPPKASVVLNFADEQRTWSCVEDEKRRGGEMGKLQERDKHVDLIVTAVHSESEKDGSYTVSFKTAQEQSGVVLREVLLHEAPKDGYQSERVVTTREIKRGKVIYLYIKSREPAIYSRLAIKLYANPRQLSIFYDSLTNPYGDRNLEPAVNLPFEVLMRLTKEAKTALREGRLPVKPDPIAGCARSSRGGR